MKHKNEFEAGDLCQYKGGKYSSSGYGSFQLAILGSYDGVWK